MALISDREIGKHEDSRCWCLGMSASGRGGSLEFELAVNGHASAVGIFGRMADTHELEDSAEAAAFRCTAVDCRDQHDPEVGHRRHIASVVSHRCGRMGNCRLGWLKELSHGDHTKSKQGRKQPEERLGGIGTADCNARSSDIFHPANSHSQSNGPKNLSVSFDLDQRILDLPFSCDRFDMQWEFSAVVWVQVISPAGMLDESDTVQRATAADTPRVASLVVAGPSPDGQLSIDKSCFVVSGLWLAHVWCQSKKRSSLPGGSGRMESKQLVADLAIDPGADLELLLEYDQDEFGSAEAHVGLGEVASRSWW